MTDFTRRHRDIVMISIINCQLETTSLDRNLKKMSLSFKNNLRLKVFGYPVRMWCRIQSIPLQQSAPDWSRRACACEELYRRAVLFQLNRMWSGAETLPDAGGELSGRADTSTQSVAQQQWAKYTATPLSFVTHTSTGS